jgi:hypothetical protein
MSDAGWCGCAPDRAAAAAAVTRTARYARAAAGAGFLVLAGALATRDLPGRVALWPAAIVPTWFGISHLVASVTGYPGCPELGAIPSVMLDRPVRTACGPWERIDRRLGLGGATACGPKGGPATRPPGSRPGSPG